MKRLVNNERGALKLIKVIILIRDKPARRPARSSKQAVCYNY